MACLVSREERQKLHALQSLMAHTYTCPPLHSQPVPPDHKVDDKHEDQDVEQRAEAKAKPAGSSGGGG